MNKSLRYFDANTLRGADSIGKLLKFLRLEQGVECGAVAAELDVMQTHVQQLEAGNLERMALVNPVDRRSLDTLILDYAALLNVQLACEHVSEEPVKQAKQKPYSCPSLSISPGMNVRGRVFLLGLFSVFMMVSSLFIAIEPSASDSVTADTGGLGVVDSERVPAFSSVNTSGNTSQVGVEQEQP